MCQSNCHAAEVTGAWQLVIFNRKALLVATTAGGKPENPAQLSSPMPRCLCLFKLSKQADLIVKFE